MKQLRGNVYAGSGVVSEVTTYETQKVASETAGELPEHIEQHTESHLNRIVPARGKFGTGRSLCLQ